MSQKGESSGERQVRFSPEVEEFPAKRQRRRRRGGSRGSDEDQNPREPSADHAEERYSKDTAPPAVRSRGGEQESASDSEDDAGRDAKAESDGLAAWHLLVPTLLIITMSVGFTLTPPDPDFYYELPEVVKEALRTEREAQKSRPVDPAFMHHSSVPAFEQAAWPADKPRPSVQILSPRCADDQYPCVATKASLEFRTDHFSVPADGERLVVIDGSRHYLDRGDTGAPQGAVMSLSFDGLQGVGPHEATVMLLTADKVVAEDAVTFNLQPSAPQDARSAQTPPPPSPPPPPRPPQTPPPPPQQARERQPAPPAEGAKPSPQSASPRRIPARAADGYAATLLSPAPGATVRSPEVRFVTQGLSVPDHGITVLRVDGQDHRIGVAQGRLAMQGVEPGSHVVQIILADNSHRVLAASEEVSFTLEAAKEAEEGEEEEEEREQPQGGENKAEADARAPPQQSGQDGAGQQAQGRRSATVSRADVERMHSSQLRELAMNPNTPERVLDWADEVLETRMHGAGPPEGDGIGGEDAAAAGAGGASFEERAAAAGSRLGESAVPEPVEDDVLGEGPWTLPGGRRVTAEEVAQMSAADLHALVSDPGTPEELVDIAENELDVRLIQGQGDLFE